LESLRTPKQAKNISEEGKTPKPQKIIFSGERVNANPKTPIPII